MGAGIAQVMAASGRHVLLNGGLWTWLATRRALGGSLVGSLRAL